MDTVMTSLPPQVGAILMENISIVQIVSMFSIGAYNALETGIVTFDTFKRYRGLNFWSMQVASWGILVHALPAMARFISQASSLPTSIPFILGWYAMVTGQAVVLYSRLNLVVSDVRKVRWVLWMIIANACVLHIPMTVLFFGLSNGDARFARPAAIFDRIQTTGFCIQDFVICGIYIYEAVGTLKSIIAVRGRDGRNAIIHLLCINTIVVILNVLLLLTEYKLHYVQVSFKTVVYSVKLKLEVSVLNRFQSLMLGPLSLRPYGTEEQHQSSDKNLVDMSFPSSVVAPEVTVQPVVAQTEIPHLSLRPSCTHGYHGTLRETSSENIISPGDASPTRSLSEGHPSTRSTESSETLPTLDLSLSRFSLKFDV
ncbi:hypothetical protein CBS147333_10123 [Penicillium roqueforti]|nr:hypothetical protein CBS147333_10123 [Penicillium roqueforti]KAI3188061.1 hypothetical protein CBS147311_10104 [Penicillium roqueforti]KAI3260890.1 hypothetical protein CBS147308_10084 [Penicillium roqueforti]KAI3277360.1 hypothetical protein DTO003C3_10125 [Penicillium roqueforti]